MGNSEFLGKKDSMNQKPLGRTTVMLPEIGLGTWNYRGNADVIVRSRELGGFLIDTAESYGTEKDVGRAIKDNREDYFIATKVSPENLRYDDVLQAAKNSLQRLDTDWIDLYQIHTPQSKWPIEYTISSLHKLIDKGKVRHIGVSNFSQKQTSEAISFGTIHSSQPR